MFRGPAIDDQSDGSPWARSVEARLQKVLARVSTADIVDRAVTAAKLALGAITGSHIATGTIAADKLASEAWTTYTPTWVNLTVGNGVVTARWARLGRTVFVDVRLVWGTTTSASGSVQCDLPVNATTNPRHVGVAHYFDAGTKHYVGIALCGRQSADNAEFITADTAGDGAVNATVPFVWTTNDELSFSAVYEAAS